jgi:hypothetical protein
MKRDDMKWPNRAPPRLVPQKDIPTIHPCLAYRIDEPDFMQQMAVQI